MVELLGIEMSEHTAFKILELLAVIGFVTFIVSGITMLIADKRQRYDIAAASCCIHIISAVATLVLAMFGHCFKP